MVGLCSTGTGVDSGPPSADPAYNLPLCAPVCRAAREPVTQALKAQALPGEGARIAGGKDVGFSSGGCC